MNPTRRHAIQLMTFELEGYDESTDMGKLYDRFFKAYKSCKNVRLSFSDKELLRQKQTSLIENGLYTFCSQIAFTTLLKEI